MIRTYDELIQLKTFDERFDYLYLAGKVGNTTFGRDRYLNQILYSQGWWKSLRRDIILRDEACNLAHPDYPISNSDIIVVHHMNPITVDDILNKTDVVTNPKFLVCVTSKTHKALHYGTIDTKTVLSFKERKPNDTCPWKTR